MLLIDVDERNGGSEAANYSVIFTSYSELLFFAFRVLLAHTVESFEFRLSPEKKPFVI